MKRLLYGVTTAQGAGATSATNALSVRNSAGTSLLVIGDDGAVRVGTNSSATTQTTASINASGSGTDIGLALVPKGTGAITAQIPDGTITGGISRGTNAVDLQMVRSNANQVASGVNSTISGGVNNRASGLQSFVGGGVSNHASGPYSTIAGGGGNLSSGSQSTIIGGYQCFATGLGSAVLGGVQNTSAGSYSSTLGLGATAGLYGQMAISSGQFFGNADSQTSNIRLRNSITGTSKTELFLDNASSRAILSLTAYNTNAARIWNAKIQLVAVCTVQGAGTVTVGEVFGGNYATIIKRIGNTTSLVGTVQDLHTAQSDINMSTSVVTITADDTNEALKIEFTPPTTAGSTTVIRVVATVYLTEVGY